MHSSRTEKSFVLEVFAATCSGCASLGRAIRLPLVCIKTAIAPPATLAALNACAYGGWTLWPGGLWPLVAEDGWSDWRSTPIGVLDSLPRDIRQNDGRFAIDMPANLSAALFEATFAQELQRLELREITTTPRWVFAQSEAGRPPVVGPRYTLHDEHYRTVEARRVDDLFAIDPVCHAGVIARAIMCAKANGARRADELLRHV